jgi:anaerobic magnesium-protoporphyrin IX monomethyl ester cyclase
MAMAKTVRPDVITILGGVYPTVLGEEAIKDPNIDYIFLGHAEGRICEFLHLALAHNENKLKELPGIGFRGEHGVVVINPVENSISGVKRLEKPDYSLIDVIGYLNQPSKDYQFNSGRPSAPIISSYGCPYNCLFCASRTISGRGTAFRPENDVLEEIELLKTRYGVENLIFIDDCLLASRPRIESILNAFIERNYNLTWKAATVSAWHLDDKLLDLMSGCVQITISVESGSQRVLNKIMRKPLKLKIIPGIVKKCKEIGIDVGANFVIGLPGETWEELRQTFRFAEKCNFNLCHFHIATPLPKTDMYEIAKKQNLLPSDFSFFDPNFFGYSRGYITTDEFTPFELMILRAYEWDRINFNTPKKVEKAAEMMRLTINELNYHRKQTRLKCGIHF